MRTRARQQNFADRRDVVFIKKAQTPVKGRLTWPYRGADGGREKNLVGWEGPRWSVRLRSGDRGAEKE